VLRVCLYPTSRYGLVVEPLDIKSRQLLIGHCNQPLAPYKDEDNGRNHYKAFISA